VAASHELNAAANHAVTDEEKMNFEKAARTIAVAFVTVFITATACAQTQKNTPESVHGAKYQPLNIKPGLWERTFTHTVAGEMPIPAEMLNRLTPEQRARMEERMKANSAAHSQTTTEKYCVTKEDVEKPFNPGAKECTWTILESTSTKARGTMSCEAYGAKLRGNGEFDAPDPEHVKGTIHTTSTGGGHSMTVDGTFSSKWLSPSCGNTH
jgi:hypothetical protein